MEEEKISLQKNLKDLEKNLEAEKGKVVEEKNRITTLENNVKVLKSELEMEKNLHAGNRAEGEKLGAKLLEHTLSLENVQKIVQKMERWGKIFFGGKPGILDF